MVRLLIGVVIVAGPAFAAPWPEQARADLAQFRHEREAAAHQFTPAELAAADQAASRAEAALADRNFAAAARLARDARWLLPARPSGLPPHVGRVIGSARLRHADRVNAIAYSPDGNRLASASRDGTVRVWDLGSGREIVTYRGHLAESKSSDKTEDANVLRAAGVAFSPDGTLVASSGGSSVHLWDAATGERKAVFTGHLAPVKPVAFGPTSDRLVSGSDDKTVIVWDVPTGRPIYTSPPQAQRVEAVAVSADGKRVASVNAAGELIVYAPDDRKVLLTLPAPEAKPGFGVAFAGSNGIVTGGGDSKARLTAGPSSDGNVSGAGTALRTLIGHDAKINSLAVSPDGRWLVTGSGDKTLRVWDLATGKSVWTFSGHSGNDGVTAVAIRPDAAEAASGGDDGAIRLWPLSAADEHRAFTDATGPVWAVATSPAGDKFAAAGADGRIRVYHAGTGQRLQELAGHARGVTALTFVGSNQLASTSGDQLVKLWNLAEGTARDLAGHTSAVLCLAAVGNQLMSGSADKTVRGWDPTTGQPLWTWNTRSTVCSLAIRPDGQRLAVGTAEGSLTLLDLASIPPKPWPSVSAHLAGVASMAFSPDGRWLATCGGDGVARLWDVPAAGLPTPTRRLEPPFQETVLPLLAVAVAPDGRTVAVGGKDPILRLWDVRTGNEVRNLRGVTDWVTALAFRSDGQGVIAASADAVVREFELARPESATATGHAQPIWCVAVSRDGKRLATGSDDKTVKVWDLETGREIATLTGATDRVNAVGFLGPNQVVGAGAGRPDHRVRWWTLAPPAEVRSQPTRGQAFNLAIAPDGARVALVWAADPTDERAVAFDIFPGDGDGPPSRVTDSGREVSCAAIAPDASLGITGGSDGVLRVWDLIRKERRGGDWPLFDKGVVDIGVTADHKTLIAIDSDGTVKIADLAARDVITTTRISGGGSVLGLIVSPSGKRFATLTDEGQVQAWDLAGQEIRSWKLPVPANAAAFAPDDKILVTGNRDGTAYVLELPEFAP